MQNVLHVFNHGIGDAVMFTAVLRHLRQLRPDWTNDVAALKGKHSAFFGMANKSYNPEETPIRGSYNQVIDHDWPECWNAWHDSPGTKTAKCLRDRFNITPLWDLLTYSVQVGPTAKDRAAAYVKTLPDKPFVLIHYEGNTSKKEKDLPHQVIRDVCDWLLAKGFTPVILDWDRRSPIPDNKTVFNPDVEDPLWMAYGTGDAETLAALVERAALFIGIDSGPQKVAFASKTPTVAVWVGHHPYHYCDHAPNAVHVVPDNHRDHLRGDKAVAVEFFARNYKYQTYPAGHAAGVIKQQAAKLLGIPHNPMATPELLTATSFHVDYYEQHRQAGLDYLGHGEWQERYGRWLVEALGLRGRTVLDVGCACGSIAAGIAKAGALVSGCDVNEHMVRLGRERWLSSTLFVCDACNLHYWGDKTFYFIHSAQVFEHFKPDLVPFILKELNRVTQTGGILFVSLDTTELFERQNRDLSTEDATHVCVKPMAWWHERLKATGWELAHDLEEALKQHPDSYLKRYDWPVFICRKVNDATT